MSTATLPEVNGAAIMDDWTTTVPEAGGNYELPPSGNHGAVCIDVLALGTHDNDYQGEAKTATKLAIIFETPGETDSKGDPFIFGVEFTHSLHEKAKLRSFLETWRGKKFETLENFSLAAVIGKACLLNVTHGRGKKDKEYANAGAATPLPKGMPTPKAVRSAIGYSPRDLAAGKEPPIAEWLPRLYGQTIADVIKESKEWIARYGPAAGSRRADTQTGTSTTTFNAAQNAAVAEAGDDDVPF